MQTQSTPVAKQCKDCQSVLPISEFCKHNKTRDGHHIYCRKCSSLRSKRWAEKNKRGRDGENERYTRHYVKVRGLVNQIKADNHCLICGEATGCCLDFHHIEATTKELNLSKAKSVTVVIEEAIKCCILCSNCHRKLHAGLVDYSVLEPLSQESIDVSVSRYGRTLLLKDLD